MIRKITSIIVLMVILSLTGCSNSNKALNNKDFEVSDDTTSKNITIGSSSEDFVKAYDGYITSVKYENDIKPDIEDINKIDYSDFCYVYLSTLFVDDNPQNIVDFMKKNNADGLDSWFEDNPEYLEKHTAVYRCLIFTFEDGNVIGIRPVEKYYHN